MRLEIEDRRICVTKEPFEKFGLLDVFEWSGRAWIKIDFDRARRLEDKLSCTFKTTDPVNPLKAKLVIEGEAT